MTYDHSNIITDDPYVVMNIYYQFYLATYYSFYKLFYLRINYINRASHYPYVFSLPCFPVHELSFSLSSDFINQLSGNSTCIDAWSKSFISLVLNKQIVLIKYNGNLKAFTGLCVYFLSP